MADALSETCSLKSWDLELWEPEEEGPLVRFRNQLKAQVLEAEEQGCQLQFLKEGCKTLKNARSQEHLKIIREFQNRRNLRVLQLWMQATSISKFRLKRLGRAMGGWQFVVENHEERQRLILEDRLEQQERRLQRYQAVGGIAMTAAASTLFLALVWFLKDRGWKKEFGARQLQMEDELQNKDREYQIELDKVEQRVKKSNLTYITYGPHEAVAEVSNHNKPIGRKSGIQLVRKIRKSMDFTFSCFVLNWLTD